jgi:hypothetical protein
MNPDMYVTMADISYSYDKASDSNYVITLLKSRNTPPKPYQPTETDAQKILHKENPALKDLWDQYVVMCSLCRE